MYTLAEYNDMLKFYKEEGDSEENSQMYINLNLKYLNEIKIIY